jgi:hypothetical protein
MDKSNVLVGMLYLVNLFEPVSNATLEGEFQKFAKNIARSEGTAYTYKSVIDRLKQRGLVVETKGRYSVTYEGLRQIAIAGLSHARDKNRLFMLKRLL